VSQKYYRFYIYSKIILEKSQFNLQNFVNETSTKIVQPYLYTIDDVTNSHPYENSSDTFGTDHVVTMR